MSVDNIDDRHVVAAICNVATGKIRMIVMCRESVIHHDVSDGEAWLEVDVSVRDSTHYVAGGVAVLRPPCPGVLDGMTLRNLPAPCILEINDAEYECVDGTAELEFDQPGTYTVTVRAFPYLDGVYEVTV